MKLFYNINCHRIITLFGVEIMFFDFNPGFVKKTIKEGKYGDFSPAEVAIALLTHLPRFSVGSACWYQVPEHVDALIENLIDHGHVKRRFFHNYVQTRLEQVKNSDMTLFDFPFLKEFSQCEDYTVMNQHIEDGLVT